MKFFIDMIKGIFIGAGAILPGISSGVLCVIFGIYDKLLDCVLNFFKDVRKNLKFLFPIILGVFIGVILFSNILKFILYKFPIQTKSIFIGVILGGTVLLLKKTNSEQKFKIKNLIYLGISLFIGISMVLLENKIGVANSVNNVNLAYLVFGGFMMSAGIVIPGVSSTIMLMLLGVYDLYLNSVSVLYFPVLIPIGVGVILGSMIFMRLIKLFLDKYYVQTMYMIIGFTLGSIVVLIPQMSLIFDYIVSVMSIICGYLIIRTIKVS